MINFVLVAWVAAGMILGFIIPPAVNLVATPIAFFHVPMAIAMEVAFVMAAWHGAAWLRTRKQERDDISFAYAEVGACCGLIATVTGSIWARINWGSYWNWDPQQMGIVAVLLTYGGLFALRSGTDDDDRRRDLWAAYAILGAVAAVFWTFIFRRLFPTLHPPDTLRRSAPDFLFVLWFNVAGYILLMVRLARYRADLEATRRQLQYLQWRL